jgi:hypothetical protein
MTLIMRGRKVATNVTYQRQSIVDSADSADRGLFS